MEDISNKTLAILVAMAIIVSLMGVMSMPRGGFSITGSVVNRTSGTANVTVQSVTLIVLVNNTIDFGVGFVNSSSSGNNCTLTSDSSTRQAGCQGFNVPAVSSAFIIENAGNTNISLSVNGTFPTARDFLCNASLSNQNCTLAVPDYKWSAAQNESGSCTTEVPDAGAFGFGVGFAKNLNTSDQRICTNFDFNASKNSITVALRLVIPRDSIQGERRDNVVFTANS